MSIISNMSKHAANSFYHDRTVLVTGADGFIGSALALRLAELGAHVRAATGPKKRMWRLGPPRENISIVDTDLSDSAVVLRMFDEAPVSIVFNAASSLDTGRSFDTFGPVLESTYGIASALLTASAKKGVQKFVQFGSIEEYGANKAPFRESDREEPFSPYSLGKTMATHAALTVGRLTPMRVCVVRPAATFGPAQNLGMLIPNVIKAGLEGNDFNMNAGEQLRDFIYVDDVVEGVLLAGAREESHGEIINLGSGSGRPVKEAVETVNAAMGKPISIHFGAEPYRPLDPMEFYMDSTKAYTLLGWKPQTDIASGIEKTVLWYRAQHAEAAE